MPRSSLPRSSGLLWPLALLLVGAAAYLWLAATPTLAGFVLASDGTILPASQLPPGAGAPGDRVVAVAGVPVAASGSVDDAVASLSPGETVDVVVARTEEPVALTWAPGARLADVLAEVGEGAAVRAVDGVEDSWTAASLRAVRTERSGPLNLTVQPAPTLSQGPVAVVRARPGVLGIAWLVATLVLLAVTIVARGERIDRRYPVDAGALLAVAAGAVGLAASAELLVRARPGPALLALACGALAASAAARTAAGGHRPLRVSAWVWIVGAAVVPVATAIAVPTVAPSMLVLIAAALMAGAGVAHAVSGYRAGVLVETVSGGVAASLAIGAIAAAGLAPERTWAVGALMSAGGVTWATALFALAQPGASGQFARRRADGGATALLEALADAVPGATPGLYVGFGGVWVRYALATHDLSGRLGTGPVEAELGDGLGLMVAEERSVPTPPSDDDPLGDWPARLGIAYAVRVSPIGSPTPVVVAGRGDPEADAPPVNLSSVSELLAEHDLDAVEGEAVAATVGVALDRLKQAPRPVAVEAEPARSQPAPAPRTAEPAPQDREGAAWRRHLEERIASRWPVEDPEALDAAERRALAELAREAGPALVVGEPGVGKEFVARALHALSPRNDERVAALELDTVPPAVVDVALFGAEEESGLVALLGDGTLILKNLSVLPDAHGRAIVARLAETPVRVIYTERYRGRETGVPSSVPRALRDACGPRTLHLTPLRDRPADVERFATFFLHRASMRHGGRVIDFTSAALRALTEQAWPLNMRELATAIERAVVTAEGEVLDDRDFRRTGRALPEQRIEAPPPEPDDNDWTPAERAERDRIAAALREYDGNRTRAAKSLGVTRGKLLRRIKKFDLE